MKIDTATAASFAVAATAMAVTPGAGFVLFAGTMLTRGKRAAFAVGSGIIGGLMLFAATVIAVYPLLLDQIAQIGVALRWAGGGYLMYLGARGLMRLRSAARSPRAAEPIERTATASQLVLEGIVSSLTNPGLFALYVLILPAFITTVRPWTPAAATLAAIHVSIATTWYCVLFAALARARSFLTSPQSQAIIAIASSGVLVALGLRFVLRS